MTILFRTQDLPTGYHVNVPLIHSTVEKFEHSEQVVSQQHALHESLIPHALCIFFVPFPVLPRPTPLSLINADSGDCYWNNTAISWCLGDVKPEYAVQGVLQGVAVKKGLTPKARVSTCKSSLFEEFHSLYQQLGRSATERSFS